MAKYNFNVALLDSKGEPQKKVKLDTSKVRPGSQPGHVMREVVKDKKGMVVMETIVLKDVLAEVVNGSYADEKLTHADKVRRGKLVRKLSTSSTANYRADDLETIQELLVKSEATPTIIAQVDEIINGEDPEYASERTDEEAAAEAEAAAAEAALLGAPAQNNEGDETGTNGGESAGDAGDADDAATGEDKTEAA